MWSNGDVHPLKGYSHWDRPWYRDKRTKCPGWWGKRGFMPVTIKTENGRWLAVGLHKGYQYYIVEYPTGKK